MRMIKAICPGLTLAGSILGLVLAAMPSSAATPPELSITVAGYGSVTVDSLGSEAYTGSCSGSTCAGTVVIGNGSNGLQTGQLSWNGTIGGVTGTLTGTSSHLATQPQLDLLFSGLTTSAAATLTVSWTDIGFTMGATPADMQVTGGGVETSASYTSYTDSTNAAFGTGTPVATLTAAGSASGPGPSGTPFSMTDTATLVLPAGIGSNTPPDSIDFLFNDTPSTLALSCGTLAAGTVGTAYTATLAASGGVSPYTYSIISGSISPLSLASSTGVISGTPTAAGTLTFTAQVKDSSGSTSNTASSGSCSIVVTTPKTTPPLKVNCPTSSATVGTYYSSTVGVTGGVPPYKYSIAFGALPAGLTLNPNTGAITGTPSTAQTGSFKIEVTDSTGAIAYTNCSGTCSGGVTVTYGGGTPQSGYGDKGSSCNYSSNGIALNCYGYSNNGSACDLYSSYVSGGPSLGLKNNYNSNQIDNQHFVQFDISSNNSLGATGTSINVTSTEGNASFDVYGSNTKGSIGTQLCSNVQACLSGYQTIPNANKYKYLCVRGHQGDVAVACLQFTYTCACAIDVATSQGSGCYTSNSGSDWWGNGGGSSYGGGSGYGGGSSYGGSSGYGSQGSSPGQCGW